MGQSYEPTWTAIGGELNQIAVNTNQSVFGINMYGVNIPETLAQLSLGVDRTVWGANLFLRQPDRELGQCSRLTSPDLGRSANNCGDDLASRIDF